MTRRCCQTALQTATRAFQDGRNEATVCCALLHDIGDTLDTFNHPDIGAAVLKPLSASAITAWFSTMDFSKATTSATTLE